ncbi:hypothetical protein BGX24_003476 [Mortierella sp. AD032]|nr:hypothetical protein BGX24_003476 [Mortierella sp. AD032]
MSNYNNTPQQPSSAYSRKQDEYHPLQNQNPQYPIGNSGQEGHYEPNGGAAGGAGVQVDSAGRPKKRNVITEARSGITHGAQAVRGGISNVEKGVGQVGDKLAKAPGVSQGVSFFADYRKFMDRGNVIDLAVAVVVGAAFTAIVTSLVTDIITPLIAMASGKNLEENFLILRRNPLLPDGTPIPTRLFAKENMTVTWNWGNFVQTVINFFIISGCVFLVVKLRCPNCTTWLDWDACAKVANLERAAAVAGGNSSPFADQGSHF